MASFKYQAATANGGTVSGSITADTEKDAMSKLRRQGLNPTKIKKAGFLAVFGGDPPPRVKLDDLVLFTRQMATMISSGIALMESLEIMQEQAQDKGFKIFGVSLDRNRERWLKGIADDGLIWTQVSDLKYFNSAAAREYNINAIPFSILLDPEGKIIAKNLRGEALHKKLEEIYGT